MDDNPLLAHLGMSQDEFIAHFGVKGMKWGNRKNTRPHGVSRKVDREAARDAKEFTKAKMFYGEGAGTRRKLIKATVSGKSKNPSYKKAFDAHLANTDMSKRASQAKSQRGRKDVRNSTAKTVRGIGHMARGNGRYASLAAAGIFTAAAYAHKQGIDRMLLTKGKVAVNVAMNSPYVKAAKDAFKGWGK